MRWEPVIYFISGLCVCVSFQIQSLMVSDWFDRTNNFPPKPHLLVLQRAGPVSYYIEELFQLMNLPVDRSGSIWF